MRKNLKLLIFSSTLAIFIYSIFLISPHTLVAETSNAKIPRFDATSYVPGEVLVKYKNNKINLETVSGKDFSSKIASQKSLQLEENLDRENMSLFKLSDSTKTVDSVVADLKNDPNVEYAEPNYTRQIETISTNDTDKGLLWALDNTGQEINGDWGDITGTPNADIDAPEAWNISEGNTNPPIVAVIDIGVLYTHPDLATNMWDGTNCVDNTGASLGGCNHGYDYNQNDKSPLPAPGDFHGTHVSGIIGAIKNNNLGVIGIAPHAKIMAIRFALTVSSEVKAIDFATQNGAKIINASYGGGGFSQAEFDAISRFKDAGGLFVAAAGNDSSNNDDTHVYPSDYDLPNIISVAATDQNDDITSFSNFSSSLVDVGAPGENILSTVLGNGYGYASGTSMATPYTAGLAALILGYKNNLTYADVKNIILNSGNTDASLAGITVSGKRINAQRALFDADIISAQSLHDGATEGVDSDQYAVGSKATLQTAIDTANTVLNNSASTETDIAQGVTDLDTATATFISSHNPADFTALNAAITSAQTLHDGATESTTPGDYIVGSKAILQTAIDAASAVPEDASQATVNAALVTLNTAVATFSSSIVPTSDMSVLTAAIASDQGILDSAVEGTLPGQYAVGSKAIFQTAIDSAGAILNEMPQSTVDTAVTTLATALTTFQSGMVDNVPPVITILGNASVTVKFGATYTDAGATATDNKEGDITNNVITVNPVDTHTAGTYHVTYNVSDLEGNIATQVTRTVIVSAKPSSSGGGGGGGGGGASTPPVVTPPTTTTPATPPLVPTTPVIPSDCQTGYLFSPSTGLPCTTGSVTNPARYLLNQNTTTSTSPINNSSCSITSILRQGSKGDQVKCLQTNLNITADGSFGPHTKSAVIIFQQAHGLVADGIVGPKTVSAF